MPATLRGNANVNYLGNKINLRSWGQKVYNIMILLMQSHTVYTTHVFDMVDL